MSTNSQGYTGQTNIKVSALIKLSMDILSLAQDVARDPAIATDIAAIQQDITDLFQGVQIMELPPLATPEQEPFSEDEAQ